MIRRGQSITFRGLAQTTSVSLDFLYRSTDIRRRPSKPHRARTSNCGAPRPWREPSP